MAFHKSVYAILPLAFCAFLADSARAADPQSYTVEISGAGPADVGEALQASAQLVTLSGKVPVPPFALIQRAREDIPRLQTALDSFGYYQNDVKISVAGHALDDPELPGVLDAIAQGTAAPVKIVVTMGPLYRIGQSR